MNVEWNDSQKIAVLCAIDDDQKTNDMNGRDDLTCPVCNEQSITYRRKSGFAMTAWCVTCNTGIKQGPGA